MMAVFHEDLKDSSTYQLIAFILFLVSLSAKCKTFICLSHGPTWLLQSLPLHLHFSQQEGGKDEGEGEKLCVSSPLRKFLRSGHITLPLKSHLPEHSYMAMSNLKGAWEMIVLTLGSHMYNYK